MTKLEDVSIHAWIQENGLKTEKGVPLDFRNHLFQYDIYRDFSPEQVNIKAAQIGDTVCKIFKTFFVAKKMGLDIIFTQPTDSDVSIFAGGKVNRIIRHNEILQGYTKDKDSVEQKQIGDAMIYYRGTFTKKAAISVTADLLVHDEVDFSDQEVIGDYESRLQHSPYKWRWYFGHPSAPEIGVAHYWEKSDQKHWFIKCEHCNEWQYMSWPDSICPERKAYICKKCKKIISDETRRKGQWIPKFKGRPFSGYWIPLLIASWVKAEKILEYHKEKSEEYFCNRVLGLPYIGSGNKVNRETILGNVTEQVNDQSGRIVIGCDTGKALRFTVGNEYGIFWYGEFTGDNKYDEIESLLKRWPKAIIVFDQGGEQKDSVKVRELKEKYLGRVYLAFYREDRKTMQLITWGKDKEEGTVVIDRNRMIQFVIDEFADRRIPLFGTRDDYEQYWTHWKHIYRVEEQTPLQTVRRRWMRSGRDDWVHATVYWRVGMSKFCYGEGKIYAGTNVDMDLGITVDPDDSYKYNPLKKTDIPIISNDWRVV